MSCLTEDEVTAFAEERLGDDALTRLEEHARGCSSCERRLLEAAAVRAAPTVTQRDGGSPPRPLRPRKQLERGQVFGRYTVLGSVGYGGMGEVYAAYDASLDRRVALKLLRGDGTTHSDRARARLQREAKSIAKLSHPNVVIVHEVGTFEDQVFVAMEFIQGPTLATWLEADLRAWRDILAIFIQAARGLSAAHQAGLIHRDFKPANVMIAKDGTARVADFGLARPIDDAEPAPTRTEGASPAGAAASDDPLSTLTNDVAGTPLYMAPEQLTAGRLDARTDQFSFCVALHLALFGEHPVADRKVAAELRGVSSFRPRTGGAPVWIRKVLARGLKTDPAERWPSMDELAAALTRDPAHRRRTIAGASLATLVVAALAVGGLHLARRPRAFCEGGPTRLAGVWEPESDLAKAGSRRQAVRDAISRSGTSEPQQTWQRVALLLDGQAAKWLGMYREACEATHVRGEQSEEILDLRMACLNDNLDSTRALTGLLSMGDRAVVAHAVEAAGALGDLSRCAAVAQLRSGIRPPSDPLLRVAVADLGKLLKEAHALYGTGQTTRAEAIADDVLKRSEAIGHCPTQAEAHWLKALSKEASDPPAAEKVFERTMVVGESCGHDWVVAAATAELAFLSRGRGNGERWFALSASVLKRMGGDPQVESWLANDLGGVRLMQGRWEEALRELERAAALKERNLGPDKFDVGTTLSNVALALAKLRRFDEARAASDRAVAITRRWVSETSTEMGRILENHGDVLLAAGMLDAAEEVYRRVARIYDGAAYPPDSAIRTVTLMGLGKIALARGDAAAAVSRLEQALSILQRNEMSPGDLAEARFRLAVALERTEGNTVRARTLAQEAVETYASAGGFEDERRDLRAWLDARPAPPERAVASAHQRVRSAAR